MNQLQRFDFGGVLFAQLFIMAKQERNQGSQSAGTQHGVKGVGGDLPGQSRGGPITDEEATGTPNIEYDLISILYHSLQGAETYAQYLEDCRRLGDEELIAFIHECIDQERQRADKVKRILVRHLGADLRGGAEAKNAGV